MHIPLPRRQALAARKRRQAACLRQYGLRGRSTALLKVRGQSCGLAVLLGRDEGFGASLADELDARLCGAAHGQERHGIGLADDAEGGIGAAVVSLPVRVVRNVTSWYGNRIVKLVRLAGGRVAEVRVERYAGRPIRVNSEGAAEAFPDAGRLKGLFLHQTNHQYCYCYCFCCRRRVISTSRIAESGSLSGMANSPAEKGSVRSHGVVCGLQQLSRKAGISHLVNAHDTSSSFRCHLGSHVDGDSVKLGRFDVDVNPVVL